VDKSSHNFFIQRGMNCIW